MAIQAVDIDDFLPEAGEVELEAASNALLTNTTNVDTTTPIERPNQIANLNESDRVLSFHLSKKKNSKKQYRLAIHHVGVWFDWRYDEIEMTRAKLEHLIENFNKKVLHRNAPENRQVPLQEGHGFMSEAPALGWLVSLDIEADILYGTFEINSRGEEVLQDENYAFVSPHYSENHVSQEIINGERAMYGPTLYHVALTNNPVLAELPAIALSKTPMFLDVGIYHEREAQMSRKSGGDQTENNSEDNTEETAPPAPPPTATPPDTSESTSLSRSESQPPAAPVAPAPPADSVTLSREEFNNLRSLESRFNELSSRFETEARRSHALSVENIISEAAGRGVPPAITNIAKSIMLSCNSDAPASISLSREEGEEQVNMFVAMKELLANAPTISFEQKTQENGDRPDGSKSLSVEEAEALGRKFWAEAGLIVPSKEN